MWICGSMSEMAKRRGFSMVRATIAALLLGILVLTGLIVLSSLTYVTSPGAYALRAVPCIVVVFLAALLRSPRTAGVAAFVTLSILALWYMGPMRPRVSFVRSVEQIEAGMRLQNVEAVMAKHERGHPFGDTHLPSDPNKKLWFREGGSFDHCVVRFDDRRVAEIELLLD